MTQTSNENPSGSTTPEEKPVGAMKNIYTELAEGVMSAGVGIEELGVCLAETNDRIDGLAGTLDRLLGRHDRTQQQIDNLYELMSVVNSKLDNQVQKLLDRVIEMAMVNQGKPTEAAVHRTHSDNSFSSEDSWGVVSEQNPDDTWPPPGCDTMELRG